MSSLKELRKLAEDKQFAIINSYDKNVTLMLPGGDIVLKPGESRDIESNKTSLSVDFSEIEPGRIVPIDLVATKKKWLDGGGGVLSIALIVPKNGGSEKKPAAPKSSAVIDQKYCGMKLSDQAAPGNVGYDYQTSADGKSLQYKTKASSGPWKTLNQSYSKWNDVVTAINALGKKTSDEAVPAGQASNAPEAESEAAKPAAPVAQDASKTVLAEVLQAMYNGKLVETKGINLKNEQKMAVVFMDGIAGGVGSGIRQSANAANYMLTLASYLTGTIPATTEEAMTNLPFLQSLQKALNSIYTAAFNYSKVTDPKLFKILSVRPGMKESVRMMKIYLDRMIKHPTQAFSKYPAKIIRLASLRRLRVRSEMEAAIVSGSAMPGRDRVV